MTWRTGRKVGRTIYRQVGPEPSDDDELIGVMDTPELAHLAVTAVNGIPSKVAGVVRVSKGLLTDRNYWQEFHIGASTPPEDFR